MPNNFERYVDAPEQYEINKTRKMNEIMQSVIYTGIYKIPKRGTIPLPGAKILIMSAYATEDEKEERSIDNRLTVVVEDRNFWPFICNLSDEKAVELRDALTRMIRWRKNHSQMPPEDQKIIMIGYNGEKEEKEWKKNPEKKS